MIYLYRCRICQKQRESQSPDDMQSCYCGGLSKRDYSSVQFGTQPFKPHFNYTLGRYVNTSQEFDDGLKRASERNTIATGMEHDYKRIDPSELKTMEPKVETQAIDDSRKGWLDKLGKRENSAVSD